ncbi:hypothetical protein M885DRAFT_589213 [Pelagophyceae sp. CCMP2097]|nr:hypothetical protein M885DRAFT_589213 [Pelagophyceae sp. CCMP2097]
MGGKKKGKESVPALPEFKIIYLSEDYHKARPQDPGAGVVLPRQLCTCWVHRANANAPACMYSPRSREHYYSKEFGAALSQEPVAVELPRLEIVAPGSDPLARGANLKELGDERVLALLARYTDLVQKQILNSAETHDAYVRRATLLSMAGEHARARADARRACVLLPSSAVALYRKGVAEYELGEHEDAATTFSAGLRLSPASTDLAHALKAAIGALRRPRRPGGSAGTAANLTWQR